MANRLSTAITNRDASPRVINNPGGALDNVRGFVAQTAFVTADAIGIQARFGSIPSNAVLRSLKLFSEDMGANTVAHFGLYDTTANGAAVVDADFFIASQSLKDGAVSDTEILHGNVVSLDKLEKQVWELLGLSADPCKAYDVVATLTVACDAGGKIALKCLYSV